MGAADSDGGDDHGEDGEGEDGAEDEFATEGDLDAAEEEEDGDGDYCISCMSLDERWG